MSKYSQRGLSSKRNGDFFERIIEKTCFEYEQLGLSYIDKINEERLKGSYKLKKSLRVDFVGFTTFYKEPLQQPKPIYIECKATSNKNSYLSFGLLKPHQIEFLHTAYIKGCISFLLIFFQASNKVIRIEMKDDIYHHIIKNTRISRNGSIIYSKGINIDNLYEYITEKDIFDMTSYIDFLNLEGNNNVKND